LPAVNPYFSWVSGLYHTFGWSGKTQEASISSLQLFGNKNRSMKERADSIHGKARLCRHMVLCLLLLHFAGCQRQSSDSGQSNHPEIVVAAAANLTDAFAEVGSRFTSKTGIRVVFSFGGTAELAKQIENGAPFDVFAAADTEHVDSLVQKGVLTPGTRALYARGRLVLWLPPGSNLRVQRIEDIVAKEFDRIAVAKPDVAPYGRATVESLRALGIWEQVEPKVIYAQNVSQAKQYASTGNTEAAFIPLALVPAGSGTHIEVSDSLHRPIDQSLAIVGSSANQAAAHQFVEFLLSDEGQEIMIRKGYRKP
jgi:molybdate transport system substrate-binding protein